MKKLLCFLLALAIVMSFSACGKKEDASEAISDKQAAKEIELPKKEKDLPSEDVIFQDVKNTLLEDNPNILSVTSIETIKSLTEEDYFYIDFSVKAESKFSDWEYEVSIDYGKYDQGWFVNDSRALTTSRKLARIPTNEEMIQFVNNDEHMLEDWDEVLPIDNGYISGEADLENGILTFCFTGREPYKHAYETTEFTSLWKYNEWDEIWEFEEADDHNGFVERKLYYEMTSDFTGHWENGDDGCIDIVDCSADQISVLWDGLTSPMVFKLSADPMHSSEENPDPKDYYQTWYTSESGYTLNMNYKEDHTWITIYESVSMTQINIAHFVDVTEDLPSLN